MIQELDGWARRAEADFALLGALAGRPLGLGESMASALPRAIHHDDQGTVLLTRCR